MSVPLEGLFSMKPYKIVMTGGRQGGKSTVMRIVEEKYSSSVLCIPESATGVLESKIFPIPDKHIPWSIEWQESFEIAVFALQLQMERMWQQVAESKGMQMILLDRGTVDCAAHLPDGMKHACELFGFTPDQLYSRYDKVLHLESVATCNPEALIDKTTPHRFTVDLDKAVELEHSMRQSWAGHPNYIFIPGAVGIEKVTEQVIAIIESHLN